MSSNCEKRKEKKLQKIFLGLVGIFFRILKPTKTNLLIMEKMVFDKQIEMS